MSGPPTSTPDLAAIVEIITAIAVVVGIAFGLVQVRQAIRNRRDYAAVDIVRTVQTQEVRAAVRRIFDLPISADPTTVRTNPELLAAALAVDSACEMWGCMVFEGVVHHRVVDRMVGGWVRGAWLRLQPWVESERRLADNPNIGEWWQWLFELIESDPDPGKRLGAHVAYRGRRSI